jgi:rhodanese-related sulfurtransferase
MNTKSRYELLLPILRKYLKETKKDWNYITPTDFYNKYYIKKRSDYVVIDIRKKKAYEEFHIPKSINIYWLDILKSKNLELLKKLNQSNKKIFLICYVGHSSSQTMTLLKLLGIDVVSIKVGYGVSPIKNVPISGWLQCNYPIITL